MNTKCAGMNCGTTDGNHSPECLAEHAAAVAGGRFVKGKDANQEVMVRFCPECGSLGDVPAGARDCCPDGSHARVVPKKFAEICKATFKMAITPSAPAVDDPARDDLLGELYHIAREKSKRDFLDIARAALSAEAAAGEPVATCADGCQYSKDVGMWPEHSCAGKCMYESAPVAPARDRARWFVRDFAREVGFAMSDAQTEVMLNLFLRYAAPPAASPKLTDDAVLGMTEDPVGAVSPELLAGLHKTGAAGGYIDFTAVYPTGVQDQLSEHQGTAFESYEFSDGVARIMTRQEFDNGYGRTLRIQLERVRTNRSENRLDASYIASTNEKSRPEDGFATIGSCLDSNQLPVDLTAGNGIDRAIDSLPLAAPTSSTPTTTDCEQNNGSTPRDSSSASDAITGMKLWDLAIECGVVTEDVKGFSCSLADVECFARALLRASSATASDKEGQS